MKLSDLPHLSHALACLAVDTGSVLQTEAEVPESWSARVRSADAELARLSPDQVDTLVMGEESEQAVIKELAKDADAVLFDAFDGDLGDVFFGPLLYGLDYLRVEEMARELTERKVLLQKGIR